MNRIMDVLEMPPRVIILISSIITIIYIIIDSSGAIDEINMLFIRILGTTGLLIIRTLGWVSIAKYIVKYFTNRHSTLWKQILAVIFLLLVLLAWYKSPESQQFSTFSGQQAHDPEYENHCDILTQLYVKIEDHLTEIDGLYEKIDDKFTQIDYHRVKLEDFSTITKLENHSTIIKNYETEINAFSIISLHHFEEVKDLFQMSNDQMQKIIHLGTTKGINFTAKFKEFLRLLSVIEEKYVIVEKKRSHLQMRLESYGFFSNQPTNAQNQKSSTSRITVPMEMVQM